MKKLFAVAALVLAMSSIAAAQDEDQLITGNLSFAPQYLWRGTNPANGLVSTAIADLNLGNFTISAEGIYNLLGKNHYAEINLYLDYSFSDFTIELADYWSNSDSQSYFNFNNFETSHLLELSLNYEPENIPIWATVATTLWGGDKDPENWEKQMYSTYFEVGGYYDFDEQSSLSLAVGATTPYSYYNENASKFSFCNIDLSYNREFDLGKIAMPLKLSLVSNPYMKKVFANFEIGISF